MKPIDDELRKRQLSVGLTTVKKAMAAIREIYARGFKVAIKKDNSPVTDADLAADKIIRESLLGAFPDYALLSEESDDDLTRLTKDWVFIIDPLDGTEEFVHHNEQFCVNIGLTYRHYPVLGIVGLPVSGEIYYAYDGLGAFKETADGQTLAIHVSPREENLLAVTSPFHTTPAEEKVYGGNKRIKEVQKVGSAFKACLIAEGRADVALKLGPGTKEWDTCAPQVVVTQAGGYYLTPEGTSMLYNRREVMNLTGYAIANKYTNLFIDPRGGCPK